MEPGRRAAESNRNAGGHSSVFKTVSRPTGNTLPIFSFPTVRPVDLPVDVVLKATSQAGLSVSNHHAHGAVFWSRFRMSLLFGAEAHGWLYRCRTPRMRGPICWKCWTTSRISAAVWASWAARYACTALSERSPRAL